MKKWFAYLFYIFVTLVVTYPFAFMLVFIMGGIRFTAADRPPGDISLAAKLVFSVGVPVFYFICLTIVFLLYRALLKQFAIELQKGFQSFLIFLLLYL